jgi:hypothetical protein
MAKKARLRLQSGVSGGFEPLGLAGPLLHSQCGSEADRLLWEQDYAGSSPATETNSRLPSRYLG